MSASTSVRCFPSIRESPGGVAGSAGGPHEPSAVPRALLQVPGAKGQRRHGNRRETVGGKHPECVAKLMMASNRM